MSMSMGKRHTARNFPSAANLFAAFTTASNFNSNQFSTHKKGWMNEDLSKDWLETVWSRVGGLSCQKLMLVWD